MEQPGSIIFIIFLIFTGASILATIALYTRQSLLVAYIVLGAILGPFGLRWVNDSALIAHLSDIGILFLLFLVGLDLDPKDLWHLLKNSIWVTAVSSFVFGLIGFALAWAFDLSTIEALIVGVGMMFSSTIIGLKLLPTTVLHHQRLGEIVVSILLLQDLMAIIAMMVIEASGEVGLNPFDILIMCVTLPALILVAYAANRYILIPLIARFDTIREYIFLLAIGWCLGIATLAHYINLSYEIGAFVAGVVIATGPIAMYIAESLRPLRDFFLVLFFFSLGAGINFLSATDILIPAILLAGLMLVIKPLTFWGLLRQTSETPERALEVGIRLGQMSEFSLLLAYLAKEKLLIGESAYYLIQVATLLTFMVSAYVVGSRYPTPIAMTDKLRKD